MRRCHEKRAPVFFRLKKKTSYTRGGTTEKVPRSLPVGPLGVTKVNNPRDHIETNQGQALSPSLDLNDIQRWKKLCAAIQSLSVLIIIVPHHFLPDTTVPSKSGYLGRLATKTHANMPALALHQHKGSAVTQQPFNFLARPTKLHLQPPGRMREVVKQKSAILPSCPQRFSTG